MKKRRIVSLALAVVLCIILIIPAMAESPGLSNFKKQAEYTGFTDVPDSAWYADSVKTVCEYGLMNGTSSSTFSPSGNVSIAEAVALACRLHDIYNSGTGSFSKTAPWWDAYVEYWHDYSGYYFTNESYSFWKQAVSRETFAWLLAEAIPSEAFTAINDIQAGSITDVDGHPDSIYQLFNSGVLTGNNGLFYPHSAILRTEAATIVARIIVPSLRVEFSVAAQTSDSSSGSTFSSSGSSSSSGSGSTTNTTTPPSTCNYIINTNTGKFHYTWCSSVKKMSEKNKWYYTGTRDSVIGMGYVPCKNCNP